MQFRSSMLFVTRLFVITIAASLVAGQAFCQQSVPAKIDTPSSPQGVAPTPAQPAANAAPTMSPSVPKAQPVPIVSSEGVPLYETIQEDWGSLDIGTSKLDPQKPEVGEVAEFDKFTRSLVRVQWRPGDSIDLWVVLPKGVKKPPVVLYLYNYLEDEERFHSDGWCERVTSGGVAAVGFLSALSTDRFRNRPMKQWFVSELQESIGSTVHDVKFILDYLESRGDLDMTKVGMFGEGSGGAIAILAGAADKRIKVIDTLEPWADWPEFLVQSPVVSADPDREEYSKPEFLKKVATLDPVKYLPDIKQPIRIQQVQHDLMVPTECKNALKAAAPKHAEVWRFEGISELSRREKGGGLFQWIKDKIQDLPTPGMDGDTKKSIAAGSDPAPASNPHP